MDNVENLSTLNVDKLHGMVCNVESVEKLSTFYVNNKCITACFVDNVEKLSTFGVDNFCSFVYHVESVEKLSTTLVDKCKSGKKEKRTELSTLIVDNSVEKCAEVLLAVARIIVPGLRLWLLN